MASGPSDNELAYRTAGKLASELDGTGRPVATENRIRAGADAAMGSSHSSKEYPWPFR
jgi:hypothetical protein